MKAIFRMGVPVVGKNYFPSNIQGLPTWYEVRVTGEGHNCASDEVDIMIAMNAQTYTQDLKNVRSGGWLIYDSTWPRSKLLDRSDITVIGVPFSKLCIENFEGTRARILMKNIAYVGALAALVKIDLKIINKLLNETFGSKKHLVKSNLEAIMLGYDYVIDNITHPLPLTVKPAKKTEGQVIIDGNTAAGLGCVYAGATVGAWYPITPSTSLMDSFQAFCNQLRKNEDGSNNFCIIQAEDELAAIGMVLGATWNGARAFTPTSGPGISLMSEFIGFAYYSELPAVIFDVQRTGPSTGMPTRTQQSDLISCAYASHGDTKHPMIFPADPKECFEFAAMAFDLADRLQTPLFVLSDLDIGMNDWMVPELTMNKSKAFDRGKVLDAKALDSIEKFGRYEDIDGDGIPYRTYPGAHPEKGSYFTRGSSHDAFAAYTEDGVVNAENLSRIGKKIDLSPKYLPKGIAKQDRNFSEIGILYFGSTEVAMQESLDLLAEDKKPCDALRIRSFPFGEEVWNFINAHKTIFVVEQNRDAQLKTLILAEGKTNHKKLKSILCFDGSPITASFISKSIKKHLGNKKFKKVARK